MKTFTAEEKQGKEDSLENVGYFNEVSSRLGDRGYTFKSSFECADPIMGEFIASKGKKRVKLLYLTFRGKTSYILEANEAASAASELKDIVDEYDFEVYEHEVDEAKWERLRGIVAGRNTCLKPSGKC